VSRIISFVLNGEAVETEVRGASICLDWLRGERDLKGTKEGCREGDCGACLVLLGNPGNEWFAVPSCLLALEELDGRQLVTIEGLASSGPTPVMLALHGEGASQCGFCSPGLVVALTGFLLGGGPYDTPAALASVDGNLCRCTGYGSIRRAAAKLAADFSDLPSDFSSRLAVLVHRGVIPGPLAASMETVQGSAGSKIPRRGASLPLGGGTDYFVRNPEPDEKLEPAYSDQDPALRRIELVGDTLEIGAAVTAREFFASSALRAFAPGIGAYEGSVASAPIRARASLAGNIANASPVADMTAMLTALGARLRLRSPETGSSRELDLERLFLAYKRLDLAGGEYIEAILLPPPSSERFFSFEKASKRANLDIAAVNSAFACELDRSGPSPVMSKVRISAGGVGPTPLLLAEASAFMEGKSPNAETARAAADLAVAACSPQSDVRGSASYRSSMVRRFVYAHLIRLAPDSGLAEELFP